MWIIFESTELNCTSVLHGLFDWWLLLGNRVGMCTRHLNVVHINESIDIRMYFSNKQVYRCPASSSSIVIITIITIIINIIVVVIVIFVIVVIAIIIAIGIAIIIVVVIISIINIIIIIIIILYSFVFSISGFVVLPAMAQVTISHIR